jgi:hypothetical protein
MVTVRRSAARVLPGAIQSTAAQAPSGYCRPSDGALGEARSMLRPLALDRVKHAHLVGYLLFPTTFRIQATPDAKGSSLRSLRSAAAGA